MIPAIPPLTFAFFGIVLIILTFVAMAVPTWIDLAIVETLRTWNWLTISGGIGMIVQDVWKNPMYSVAGVIIMAGLLRFAIGI